MSTRTDMIPDHRWTGSALKAAKYLHSLLEPFSRSPEEISDCQCIMNAIEAEDLYLTMEALRNARVRATTSWRAMHSEWLLKVQHHILKDRGEAPHEPFHPSQLAVRRTL